MARTYQLSEKDANRLEIMLRWFERERKEPMQGRRRLVMDSGSEFRLAKTQQAAPSSNKISVKFLDADGNVTGDAFYAYGFFVDGAATFDEVTPIIASGVKVPVFFGNDGNWYLDLTLTTVGDECES